jgi:hypothetical protein
MIKNILDLLPYVEDGSENIRIAKGKNYLPKSFREAFNQFKRYAMAKTIQVELQAKTDKAIAEIEDLKKEIQKLNKEVEKGNKQTEEGLKGVENASKSTAKGIKGIGNALKAAGIGLAIAAFAQLKEIFQQNQKVADLFSTAFEVVSLAFNDFVNFIVNNTSGVVDFFKAIFEDPKQSLLDFADAFKRNIQERFESYLDTLGFIASAVKKVFSGDFKGALEDVKSAGKESLDVLTGVNNIFDKGTEAVTKIAKATSEYVSETVKAAQSNVELGKQAEIARVRQQGIIESFDLQAEKLRQVRDEERNTIAERIEANNKLKATLDEQEQAMLKQVDLQIAAAKAEFDKNQNQENTIALLEAQQEREAVLAQIAGFRSEQLANDLALNREKLELEQSITDAESERAISEARFTAEQIDNEYRRLQALLDVNEQERLIEEKRLTEKRDAYKEGTQAFQDAQNELLTFQQENAQQQKAIEKDLAVAKQEEIKGALGNIAGIVGQNSKFGKAIAVVQAIQDTYAGANKALAQGGIFGFIGAAAVIAGGLANVKQITASKPPSPPSYAKGSGGSPSISTPTTAVSTPPAFNIVGAGGTSQLAEAIGSQAQEPVKAYVVSNDVSTAQELDRNIVKGASLG